MDGCSQGQMTKSYSQSVLIDPKQQDYLVKKNFVQNQIRIPLTDTYKSIIEKAKDYDLLFQQKSYQEGTFKAMQKTDERIKLIVEGLHINDKAKKKMVFSLRNSITDQEQYAAQIANGARSRNSIVILDQKQSQQQQQQRRTKKEIEEDLRLPKLKHKDIGKQITEMKLKKIDKITKTYLKDYTVFNYKIDTVLNEAYGFIKNHNR